MKKRTNIIILISLLGFTLSNCIDEFDAKIPDGGVGLLVVEGEYYIRQYCRVFIEPYFFLK